MYDVLTVRVAANYLRRTAAVDRFSQTFDRFLKEFIQETAVGYRAFQGVFKAKTKGSVAVEITIDLESGEDVPLLAASLLGPMAKAHHVKDRTWLLQGHVNLDR